MISSILLYISQLIQVVSDRIFWGFLTLPTLANWLNAIVLMFIYAVFALSFGFWLNFLKFKNQFPLTIAIKIITTSLIAPSILEELFFRVILLPHPSENMNYKFIFVWSIISLFLFVIYHPLNAITFFPAGREAFFNPVFLCLAGLLGLICTVAYLQTGSIWISVFIHWLTVIIWLLYLGGIEKLNIIKLNM